MAKSRSVREHIAKERINNGETIAVAKKDLVAAWMILENLAVSLDQIGGVLSDSEDRLAMLEALDAYLSPERFREINKVRVRLGDYIPDDEAERLSEHKIPYWNYAGLKAYESDRLVLREKPGERTHVIQVEVATHLRFNTVFHLAITSFVLT